MPTDTEAHQRCIKLEQKVDKLAEILAEQKKENAKLWVQLARLDRRTENLTRAR